MKRMEPLQFLNDADARHLSGETRRKYVLLFKQLDAFAKNKGIVYVDSLDLTAVTEFRSSWTDGPLSASKKLERLRSLLKFAAVRKWIVENPALLLKPPKVKQTPTLPFSTEEMDNILNAADARIRPFILTMRYSGLRISDVTVLRVSALTNALESGSNGRKRAPKYSRLRLYTAKTDEPVSVLIPEHVAKSLSGVQHKNPEHFFWSGRSKLAAAVSLWRKRLADVFTKAKIENGHSHRFRDTFAVSLLEKGVSLENVAMLLGNSPKVAYKHYAPWVKTRQEALDIAVKAALGASKAANSR